MRILIITHIFSDIMPNGLMVATWNVVNALAEKDVMVYVVSRNTKLSRDKSRLHPNIKLYTIGSCQRNITFDKRCVFFCWLFSIPLIILKKIDFVFVMDSIATPFSSFKIRPIAVRVLKTWDYDNPQYGNDLLFDRARKREEESLDIKIGLLGKIFDFLINIFFKLIGLNSFYWRQADVIFYQVKELAKNLPPKAVYLPNSVDIKKFICRPFPKNDSKFIFLFIGHLGKRKGVEYLVRAFNKLSLEYNNLELWLIGSGSIEMIDLLKKQITNQQVKFIGKIPADKVVDYFSKCDVFVLPSLGESFPTAVLEAMACGKPVITTRGGGIADFFLDQEMGFLIEPGKVEDLYLAMKNIYHNPLLAEKMGKAGRDYVLKNLSQDCVAKIILKAFNNYKNTH